MKIYNSLSGQSKQFAKAHEFSTAEFCDRADRPPKKCNDEVSKVAGNGNHGFRTRRKASDPVKMVEDQDGHWKRDKKVVARSRRKVGLRTVRHSTKCTKGEVILGELRADRIVWGEREKQRKRTRRRRNRNRRAGRIMRTKNKKRKS